MQGLILDRDRGRFMKRYLLFFTSALFFTAMNAQAESFWLILQNSTYGIEKIEMKNMSQCQYQKQCLIGVTG